MTALRVIDNLQVLSSGSFVGYAKKLDFNSSDFVLTTTSDQTVSVSLLKSSSSISLVAPVFNEIPSGLIDGMNMVYTLVNAPVNSSLMLFQNGRLLREGTSSDYVLNTSTISMMSAPLEDDVLVSSYLKVNLTYQCGEIPSGSLDTVNKDFYLDQVPIAGTLMLFLNGIFLTQDRDYVLTGNHIVIVPGLTTCAGDSMFAYYEYL